MKLSSLGLAALTFSVTQLLPGQSDQSQPSTYRTTTPSAQPAPSATAASNQSSPPPKNLPAAPDEANRSSAATSNTNQEPRATSQPAASQPAQNQAQAAPSTTASTAAPANNNAPGQNVASQSTQQPPQSQPSAQPQPQQKQPPPATPANATAAADSNAVPRIPIQLAPKDARDHSAAKLAGHHVRDSEGRDLGKVKDFLVDRQTGQADFALISSSGIAGIGDKLRLVPLEALQRTSQKDEFALDIHEDQWKELTPLAEDVLKSGQITIPDSERRQLAQTFLHRTDAPKDSGFYSAGLTGHLVRASDLTGRDVSAAYGHLGKIDAVVLDLTARNAQALITPNKDFTGMKQKLLVPFRALTVSAGERPQVSTFLTRADFHPLHPRGQAATGAQPSAGQPPAGGATAVASAAAPQPGTSAAQANAPAEAANAKQAQNVAAVTPPAASANATPSGGKQPAAKANVPQTQAGSAQTQVATNEKPGSSSPTKQQGGQQIAAAPAQAANPPAQNQADRSGSVAANDKSSANQTQGQNLSPTGATSADSIPAGTDPALLATARAIRKAIDDDRALASTDVRVTPEEGKIVLRGRVSDQKTKTAIIEKATHELKGWKINDQISVDTR